MDTPLPAPSRSRTDPPADLGTSFDELRTRALLGGDDEQITLALALIDHHLRRTMSLWLRRHMRSLREDDRADVWAETLLSVLKAARRHRFDSSRPLMPWLCRIARARAIDHLRRRTAWESFLLNRPRPQQPPTSPHLGEQNELAADLRALIDAFLATLPAVQRTALAVFLEHYPETRATKVLQHKFVEHTGQASTRGAVKRAMLVARGKLCRFLSEHGHDWAECHALGGPGAPCTAPASASDLNSPARPLAAGCRGSRGRRGWSSR